MAPRRMWKNYAVLSSQSGHSTSESAESAEWTQCRQNAAMLITFKSAKNATERVFQQKSRLDTFLQFGYLTALSSNFLRLISRFNSRLSPNLCLNRAIYDMVRLHAIPTPLALWPVHSRRWAISH